MAGNKVAFKGLNILSIDGGGAGGLSALFVLEEIMKRLHELEGREKPLIPAKYFDLIAGTGAGGVIACMLGRLGMSPDQAIKAFIKIANTGFERKYIGRSGRTVHKAAALRGALKLMVRDAIGDENATMRTDNEEGYGCKTIVFAMSMHHIDASVPVLFRSYLTSTSNTSGCSIWEALYATMAHPDLFKPIDIVYDSIRQPFICAELGCGNPIAHVLTEVGRLYPDRQVSSVLSIGSGQARIIHIPKPNLLQRVLWMPNQTATAVVEMAIDSGDVKEQMVARFRNTTHLYYRFNVDQGLQTMQGDWERQSEVKAHTTAYMKKAEVGRMMNHAAKSVKEKANVLPVKYIDGAIQVPAIEEVIDVKDCPAPNPVFTGREDLVRRVGNFIAGNTNERRVCVVHGMGGAGKTQIALKAIQLNRETWEHVLYVDASSKKAIEGALSDFAKARGLGRTFKDTLNWLGLYRKPWLLVLDSADHPSLGIRHYFPHGDGGSILITTRLPAFGIYAHGPEFIFHVSEMSKEDALALFFKVLRIQDSDLDVSEMEAAHALLESFGYLALAIVQAGAYIAYSLDISISQYRKLFLKRKQRMLEQYIALGALVELDDYGRSVYTTFQLCYDLLREDGDARPTLWLIAYLQHDDIRPDIFRRAAAKVVSYKAKLQQTAIEQEALQYMQGYLSKFLDSDGHWDPTVFSNAMNELASYSLVEFDRVNQAYRIHVLIQDWARTSNPQQELARECLILLLSLSVDWSNTIESLASTRNLRRHLEGILPKDTTQVGANHLRGFGEVYLRSGNWGRAKELWMHLLQVMRRELGEEHPDTLASMNRLAATYEFRGQWDKAQSLREQVLGARKRVLGEDHPDTLKSMNGLAETYRSQGRWEEAQSLRERILDARKRVLGEDHPDTLKSMNCLASMYQSQGRWDEAQLLQEQALNEFKRALGEDHPDTLKCISGLAATYESQGGWERAQSLREQVLDARKQALGEEHPDTLKSMKRLAATYEFQSQWEKAQSLQEQVLDTQKRVLGEDHPDTLKSMNNLAHTYRSRGQWDEAQSLQEQVLDARKRVLGDDHPDTLKSMNGLAGTYQFHGQWDNAQSLRGEVLNARKRVLGEEHPHTLRSMNNLASTYRSRDQWVKAQSLREQVLDTRKRVLGEDHPDTLKSMNGLADICQSQSQWEKAQSLREQVLNVRKRVLGDDHPDTLKSMNSLAATYQSRGQWDKTQLLREQVLDARKRVLGEVHPDTLRSMNNLAGIYQSRGQWDKGQSLYEHVLGVRKRLLGEEHPYTLQSMDSLALAYQSQGQWDDAQSLRVRVLNAYKRVLGEEHPDTLTSMNSLAITYQSQGQWDNAQLLRDQVLNARKRVLGEEHPQTLQSMHNLAFVYAQLGRFGESEKLAAAVETRKHIVGEQHEIVAWARKHIEWLRLEKASTPSPSP